ncbi:MAG: class I SAM-dependent methyltransferase [Ardenticatenia bacterium]|nr:MAG: class I SAM-dependent methyltransferase [Ardenticatenia bacterium]
MKTQQRAHTKEEIIATYNAMYAQPGKLRDAAALYRWVLDLLSPQKGAQLLDVACGEGVLVRLAEARGIHAVGIDVAWRAAIIAQQSTSGRIVVGEGEALPFPDATFDFVTNLGSLEHFLDPEQGVQEMRRVLKPGGVAAVLLPNSYYLADIIWHVWRTGYGPNHKQPLERFATFGEWRDMLEAGGFHVEKGLKYNFLFPRSREDWQWYFQHPRKFLYLAVAPLMPFHLSYSFLYICRAL